MAGRRKGKLDGLSEEARKQRRRDMINAARQTRHANGHFSPSEVRKGRYIIPTQADDEVVRTPKMTDDEMKALIWIDLGE